MPVQPGVLAPVPLLARYLAFEISPAADVHAALTKLADVVDAAQTVVGIGRSTVLAPGCEIPGLRDVPVHCGAGIEVPSTPASLWCWLRGDDRGELLHRTRALGL